MKIVTNRCYGGFSLSSEAEVELCRRAPDIMESMDSVEDYWGSHDIPKSRPHPTIDGAVQYQTCGQWPMSGLFDTISMDGRILYCRDVARNHPELVKLVEDWGERANGSCARLKVTEVPDGVDWCIEEYDGQEWVAEKHSTW